MVSLKKLTAYVDEHKIDRHFIPKGKPGKTGIKHLRRCDMYGHPVELNFNGETHVSSTCGGGVSIIAKVSILIYVILIFLKLNHTSDNKIISSHFEYSDISSMQPISIAQMGIIPYAIIETTQEFEFDRVKMSRYVNITFAYGNKKE